MHAAPTRDNSLLLTTGRNYTITIAMTVNVEHVIAIIPMIIRSAERSATRCGNTDASARGVAHPCTGANTVDADDTDARLALRRALSKCKIACPPCFNPPLRPPRWILLLLLFLFPFVFPILLVLITIILLPNQPSF